MGTGAGVERPPLPPGVLGRAPRILQGRPGPPGGGAGAEPANLLTLGHGDSGTVTPCDTVLGAAKESPEAKFTAGKSQLRRGFPEVNGQHSQPLTPTPTPERTPRLSRNSGETEALGIQFGFGRKGAALGTVGL